MDSYTDIWLLGVFEASYALGNNRETGRKSIFSL